jgi:outer membrane receptor protein involved in Fe transport
MLRIHRSDAEGDYGFHYTSYQADDNFAITKGSHSVRARVALERIQSNTLGAGNNNSVVSFGSLQSFLTNQPSSFQATLPGTSIPESLRQYIVGTYLQDDWRVRRNLTLNVGLRYEMATVPTEEHDLLGTLVPGSQPVWVISCSERPCSGTGIGAIQCQLFEPVIAGRLQHPARSRRYRENSSAFQSQARVRAKMLCL